VIATARSSRRAAQRLESATRNVDHLAVPVTVVDGRAVLNGVALVCPSDKQPLALRDGRLTCPAGHAYRTVGGIPILLGHDLPDSHPYFEESRQAPETATATGAATGVDIGHEGVDPFVQQEIVKTNGILYRGALGALTRYPIPEIPLPPAAGARLLDVGCNWGRWSIAASRRGYVAIGIDPGLAAVQAAYRVARALGQTPEFLVGDGRTLPFPDGTFDVVYSYSVLQHFSKEDARAAIREAARVTRPGGKVLIQLANILGVRQLYNQARDTVRREQNPFRVRRWTPGEMLSTFRELVGPAQLTADGFFSLNAQPTDLDIMKAFPRMVVRASEGLKQLSRRAPALARVADSVFIEASRPG
jgi:SAM-dependent methyltransferase